MPDILPPAAHPTAEWNQLQDKYYRKQEVYTMLWKNMDLSKYKIAAAPFGGPIAMIRDENKILMVQKQSTKPMITIYTAAGRQMSTIQWDKGRIVGMGWTDTEQLVCVMDDGTVRIYTIHGEYTQFSLGKEAKENGIEDCRIWGSGLVALTGNFMFIMVNAFEEPYPKIMADPGLNEPPHSWIVVEPQFTLSRAPEVLVATRDTVLVVDAADVQDQRLTTGPYKRIAVSPNGRFLALFTANGHLEVISTDMQKNLSELDTKTSVSPNSVVWCGTDSVVLYWDRILLMVGPRADIIKYTYDEPLHLVPEVDGIRIISNEKCEFLQRVPDVLVNIFNIGSTSPSALLYDAWEHFEKKSPKADENLRSIRGELAIAIDECLEASRRESVPYYQKALLKAASFGKCFIDTYDSNQFVEVAMTIRVLNAVRYYEIGIPLTDVQFKRLTGEVLIDRLINRHQHLLAFRIAEYLHMKNDRVLVHWACAKVKKADLDDRIVCQQIVEKLGNQKGISYAEVAKTAYKVGRPELATQLLDYEPRAAEQVPLLISMQEDERALIKAIESGDTDLVYLVITHLKRKLALSDFFRLINDKPLASSLLEVYSKQKDRELLKDFYYQADRRFEGANVVALEAYEAKDLATQIRTLKTALSLYQDDKEQQFSYRATDDEIKLLLFQDEMQKEKESKDEKLIGLSLAETLRKCVILNQNNRVLKLKGDFKISDKKFWWIKVKALAETKNWLELEKFAKSKKSPIGFVPFVEQCLLFGSKPEALKHIARCEPNERPIWYMKLGAWSEAAEAAFGNKDVQLLQEIKQKSVSLSVGAQVDGYLSQLMGQR